MASRSHFASRLPKRWSPKNPEEFQTQSDKLMSHLKSTSFDAFGKVVVPTALVSKRLSCSRKFRESHQLEALCLLKRQAPKSLRASVSQKINLQRRDERAAHGSWLARKIAEDQAWSLKGDLDRHHNPMRCLPSALKDPDTHKAIHDQEKWPKVFEDKWGSGWKASELQLAN